MPVADTSFLIDVLRGDAGAVALLDEQVAQGRTVWLPTPVLHELHYGAGLHAVPDKELQRVDELERALPVLVFDAAAARTAGGIEASLDLVGRRPSRVDCQIAAIALGKDEPVVTRDARFDDVPGLRVLTYDRG